ncbi:ATP-dependent DNA helicase [Plakobranchus ocellatus]|uniref:ATP-dependent DNA helicase n=1 Tax=Plakobranchus ocellatus TaxID=259542 RepID=A0AAV4CQM9_9GAST|nr:ATP-dependent DNA helicase [Plakobranchus ocellatus]
MKLLKLEKKRQAPANKSRSSSKKQNTSEKGKRETAVLNVNNFAILTLGSCTQAFSSAIVKEDDIYYIFDPRSRDSAGMASPDGTTVRISHVSVAKVKQYLLSFATSLGLSSCPFELTLVDLQVKTLEPVYHNLQPVVPSRFEESSDSDVPLASIQKQGKGLDHVFSQLDSDDLPLVEIQRKSYVRRKTRRKVLATSWASSSDQSDWNSDKDLDYVPQDEQPSDDDWMPTEKMRTPRKSTQSQPITPLKYMQVYVDAMRVIADPGDSDCEPQDNHRGPYRLVPPPANKELRVGNQDCFLHSPETLIPTSTASQTEDLDYMPTDTSIVASPEISQIVRGRKRRRNENIWKDMKRKKALNLGEEYTNRKGKVVGRKIMKAGCGTACRI